MPDDAAPFVLDLIGVCGELLAQLEEPEGRFDLHERTTWLRLRSDVTGFVAPTVSPEDDEITGFVPPAFAEDRIAALVHVCDQQDFPDRTVGMFHGRLEPEQLDLVRKTVTGLAWPRLPMPVGGDRHATHFTLRYASGKLLIERRFNLASSNFIEAISPLWELLRKLTAQARKGQSGTLEPLLEVRVDPARAQLHTFNFGLRNRSIGPVALTDPRLPTRTGAPRIELRVGECVDERDWMPPYDWTLLELPRPAADEPKSRMIASRRRWEISLPWVAPKPGTYEVQARWRDYEGPVERLPGQTPFMPVPMRGPAFIGSGPYPMRGSCWTSARFEVTA